MDTGLVPYDHCWMIEASFYHQYRNTAPQLYEALRNDPLRYVNDKKIVRYRSTDIAAFVNDDESALSDTVRAALSNIMLHGTLSATKPGKVRIAARKPRADDSDLPEPGDDDDDDDESFPDYDDDDDDEASTAYPIINGIALLCVEGPMTRKPTSAMWMFGGTSTIMFRQDLRDAANNPKVKGILIDFHTPGGQVFGTYAFAADIAKAGKMKPVEGFAGDLCASAGYWGMSQCTRVSCGASAMVGSIGTYMVVEDSSKMADALGINVIVIRAGKYKGAGEGGTKVTPDQIKVWQSEVDALNAQFLASVSSGRGIALSALEEIADGRVYVGDDALAKHLVDEVTDYDAVLSRMIKTIPAKSDGTFSTPVGRSVVGGVSMLPILSGAAAGQKPIRRNRVAASETVASPGSPATEPTPTPARGRSRAARAAQAAHADDTNVGALFDAIRENPDAVADYIRQSAVSDRDLPPFSDNATQAEGAGTAAPLSTDPASSASELANPITGETTITAVATAVPLPVIEAGREGNDMENTNDSTVPGAVVPGQPGGNPAAAAPAAPNLPAATAPAAAVAPEQSGVTIGPAHATMLAALFTAGITSEVAVLQMMQQAADGREAKAAGLAELQKQMVRARGAEATASVDFSKMYGAWGIAEIATMAAEMKAVGDMRLAHPNPAAGAANTNGSAPLMTTVAPLGHMPGMAAPVAVHMPQGADPAALIAAAIPGRAGQMTSPHDIAAQVAATARAQIAANPGNAGMTMEEVVAYSNKANADRDAAAASIVTKKI